MATPDIEGFTGVELIAQGGSAKVYRALQPALDRRVAIKVIKEGWDHGVRKRFARERKAMGRLSERDGVLPVYASGELDDGSPYLVLPFIEGGSLADRISTRGPLPWDDAVRLMTSVARTIQSAHDRGVLHRDLKPGNILLDVRGWPLVSDFGIARMIHDGTITESTGVALTPAYSPPEAFEGAKPTAQTDVYGLGSTLWALLAGRPPFTTPTDAPDSVLAVARRVMTDPVPPLPNTVPPDVRAVVVRAMSKKPAIRHPTAAEFADDLQACLGDARTTLVSARPPVPQRHPPRWDTQPAPPRWRRLAAPLGLAGLLALTGAAGMLYVSNPWRSATTLTIQVPPVSTGVAAYETDPRIRVEMGAIQEEGGGQCAGECAWVNLDVRGYPSGATLPLACQYAGADGRWTNWFRGTATLDERGQLTFTDGRFTAGEVRQTDSGPLRFCLREPGAGEYVRIGLKGNFSAPIAW